MKLPGRRRRSKKAKALDVAASLTKTWMESKAVKSAGQTVAKGAKKASSATGAVGATRLKAIGAVALVGGAVAAVARKLKGGREPDPFATSAYEPADAAATTNGGAVPPVAEAPDPEAAAEEPGADAPDAEDIAAPEEPNPDDKPSG
jgi:hypothetical protein